MERRGKGQAVTRDLLFTGRRPLILQMNTTKSLVFQMADIFHWYVVSSRVDRVSFLYEVERELS